jgi:pimeloyl-ACP methyl ester carboxylesterase/class 3 adenylate cyclase
MRPETRYAKSGDIHIAYQVLGDGPTDLVVVPLGVFTNLEWQWEEPSYARFLQRLASFSRLILFDPRGTGLSDKAPELPIMEQQMDDLAAVLDAVGSERAVVLGISTGGPMAILFTATYPGRVSALVLYASFPTAVRHDDYPWGRTPEFMEEYLRLTDEEWGTGAFLPLLAPTRAGDDAFRSWWTRFERLSSGPGNALAYVRMTLAVDVRPILATISVPTLVLHRRNDAYRHPAQARYLAERIPGAKLVELPGVDHLPYAGDSDALVDEIEGFVTWVRPLHEAERVLATVLFTDIVGSTRRAAELGDRQWRELMTQHDSLVRSELTRFRGREVDRAGDGFLATFDGPARAIRCALAVREALGRLELDIRAGVHTGEVEVAGLDVRGIAVHIGARIASLAEPGEVLASSTVKDLVVGSGIEFQERGLRSLKGVPEPWRLYAVTAV